MLRPGDLSAHVVTFASAVPVLQVKVGDLGVAKLLKTHAKYGACLTSRHSAPVHGDRQQQGLSPHRRPSKKKT